LAIPPILAGAYSGVESVDRAAVDASRALGMTEWQILCRVEVPLALPLIVGGLRSAVLQVVATATVAAYLPLGGLGRYLFDALPVQDYAQMLSGA
ncbi:ABC transporter permease, partial [Leucobacter sp. M11]|uniref:ABC transporter permease n=1 Tax=Leucobacter sp. M11 TaxID=2993565 RepID=UPI002D81008C